MRLLKDHLHSLSAATHISTAKPQEKLTAEWTMARRRETTSFTRCHVHGGDACHGGDVDDSGGCVGCCAFAEERLDTAEISIQSLSLEVPVGLFSYPTVT